MKTGNTHRSMSRPRRMPWPQWSPVMKTGNTARLAGASTDVDMPQWSPVMKTGNTGLRPEHASPLPLRLNGARS